MSYNISDSQHQENRRALEKLKTAGFEFECDADHYRVAFKGEFIRGAGVRLPRSKPLHWRHAEGNRRDNLANCVNEARRFAATH